MIVARGAAHASLSAVASAPVALRAQWGAQRAQARRRPEHGRVGLGFVAAAGSIASGAVGTGTVLGASWAATVVPIIGPALAMLTMAISSSIARRNAQKTAATRVVDEVEPDMERNREIYMQGPRTRSAQEQALANFDAMWAHVAQACSNPQLGSAGQRCISERQPGGKWDWFAYYRDPIATDSQVQEDPVFTGAQPDIIFGPVVDAVAAGSYGWALPLIGGLLVVAGWRAMSS